MPIIRPAVVREDLRAVYRFRYAVYVEEMARRQKYARHEDRTIVDPLDVPAAQVLAAWEGDEVVGTVRCNCLRSCEIFEYLDHYGLDSLDFAELESTSITTRLMVHPRFRGTTLATRLACAAYQLGLDLNINVNFIDCNAHLIDFFSHLGYQPYRTDLIHPEYGSVFVMRLNLHDTHRLQATRSPFLKLHRKWAELRRTITLVG